MPITKGDIAGPDNSVRIEAAKSTVVAPGYSDCYHVFTSGRVDRYLREEHA